MVFSRPWCRLMTFVAANRLSVTLATTGERYEFTYEDVLTLETAVLHGSTNVRLIAICLGCVDVSVELK